MHFSRSLLLALASAFAAHAQQAATGPNAFTNTAFPAVAGQDLTLKWTPTTSGTVSLILRSGASSNLNAGEPIAQNIPNNGEYTWSIPESAVRGSDYTIEIVSDSNPSDTNYSAYFVLESDNTTPASTASSVSAAPLPTTLSTAMTSSMSESMTGTESAATTSAESANSRTSSPTASPTTSGDLQATAASSTSDSGAGARATAMVGMLGAVALGALAL
ncbi:hypothetical protein CERZMDRAFT_105287 [Cercospora zeae-maydis SCOH1-5]|uniref:Yeast cell wall synthesis Kre9/Knh1-like N-terminal domain-containing protein n=1 Tax=Cercospora zeae-maydis SCOH1-5 TaxID=717836 RepID=A0A6A6FMX5_9PEZI|nr:hypothetical protein CERZMDRAFT_105287 [Cercospora zeae-maydis SCOH1-5]